MEGRGLRLHNTHWPLYRLHQLYLLLIQRPQGPRRGRVLSVQPVEHVHSPVLDSSVEPRSGVDLDFFHRSRPNNEEEETQALCTKLHFSVLELAEPFPLQHVTACA